MQKAVYYQSWSSPWVSSAKDHDLTRLHPLINTVFLSFANPETTYRKGAMSFNGTGLDFSSDFNVIKGAIAIAQTRGVKVLLAVGGATYMFGTRPASHVVDLALDLGCDGIDIDWEPLNGAADDDKFGPIIQAYRAALGPSKLLTAAVFSTGAYGKDGSTYKGMNIKGLTTAGSLLDQLQIMAYDAGGPEMFDPLGAFIAYRIYYPGPLLLGFEPGPMGWGSHILKEEEVVRSCAFVCTESQTSGIFIWSLQKDTTGSPSVARILELAAAARPGPADPPSPPDDGDLATVFPCPNCKYQITVT